MESDCALIGGETAEMPGVYEGHDFDCAGFSVGVVDRTRVLGRHRVKPGMKLIGVSSSGFHSNGFSLLRKVFAEDLDAWKEVLLKPTALYVKLVHAALKIEGLEAIAHITGGGMDNIPRVLPDGTAAQLNTWPVPPAFLEVKKRSGMSWPSMLTTLNCGLGMVWIVRPAAVEALKSVIISHGHRAFELGEVVETADKSQEASWYLNDPEWEGEEA